MVAPTPDVRFIATNPPPPKGFVWAEDLPIVTASKIHAPRVYGQRGHNWGYKGYRLIPPPPSLTSWYDSGARLEAPEPSLDDLFILERLGNGTQSEVLLGEMPGIHGLVAVKVGLKKRALARETAVLSAMFGQPGFPTMLLYEPEGPLHPGGVLVVELLGASLFDLWDSRQQRRKPEEAELSSPPRVRLDGDAVLKIGRSVVRRLRQLHAAGFVHNDVKPANLLLGEGGSKMTPTRLHLIDFGSCTRVEGFPPFGWEAEESQGPIGTASFASVAADARHRPLRPSDDIESLTYVLAYLAKGYLPWNGQPESVKLSRKRELLESADEIQELTVDIHSRAAATAIEALWAQVRRCHGYDGDGNGDEEAGVAVDYGACLAALSGDDDDPSEEADAMSEFSLMAALGERGSSSSADNDRTAVSHNARNTRRSMHAIKRRV